MNLLAKHTTATAALLAMNLMGNLTGPALAGDPEPRAGKTLSQVASVVSDRQLVGWVEKRVQEWQVSAAERRFDDIGWAKDIRDAERLAQKHRRPIFLFTHAGRMAIGRC
jgi:hypothetical protein